MSDPLAQTVGELAGLLQVALETHERMEAQGASPVGDVCEALGLDPVAVPMEHLATLIFAFTVFGTPALCRSQESFQKTLLDALPMAERMVYRQVRTQPVRAWRYHAQPASRDVVRQLAGPDIEVEELADGLLDLASGPQRRGGVCLGWPVNAHGLHVVVSAGVLSADAEGAIAALSPFPMPNDEHAFWSDHMEAVLLAAIDPMGVLRPSRERRDDVPLDAFRDGAHLVLQPVVQPHELLERVIVAADFRMVRGRTDWYRQRLTRVRWLREMIAGADPGDEALDPVRDALAEVRHHLLGYAGQSRFDGADDPALEDWLPLTRILAGFGIVDGTMPAATEAQLRQLATEVLLLPDDHPIHVDVHGREPIRAALEWARETRERSPEAAATVELAFARLRQERRWAATFSALDLEHDGHVERIDLATVTHALRTLFDPRALDAPLARLELDARQLNWIETALRPKPYTPANEVTVGDLPETEAGVLGLRNVGPTGLMQLKASLLDLAQTWRARALGHEPRSMRVQARTGVVAPGGDDEAETLNDGLAELAALFGDE